ncbi:hypothetical protein OROHE_008351 [Orobanche hederae]
MGLDRILLVTNGILLLCIVPSLAKFLSIKKTPARVDLLGEIETLQERIVNLNEVKETCAKYLNFESIIKFLAYSSQVDLLSFSVETQLATQYLTECISSERRVVEESGYAVSAILNSSKFASTSRSKNLQELLDENKEFTIYRFDISSPLICWRVRWPKKNREETFKDANEVLTVVPRELSIVTGVPNSGKSEWIDALICNVNKEIGWKSALCSMENKVPEHARKLLEKHINKPFLNAKYGECKERISIEELMQGQEWLNDTFTLIRCENDSLPSIDWVLALARVAVLRYGINGLVIDPYNELDHQRPANHRQRRRM